MKDASKSKAAVEAARKLIKSAEETIKLEMTTTKVKMVKTRQRCSCGWPVVAYVERTKFVRCLDCKEPVEVKEPKLSEYEQWVQNLKND